MGNCELCCKQIDIDFIYEKNSIIIIKREENQENKKETIFENVENINNLQNLIEIIKIIYYNIDRVKIEDISFFKITIKTVLSEILKKEEVKSYLKYIDNIIKDKTEIKNIVKFFDIFKIIYSKRNELTEQKKFYFI